MLVQTNVEKLTVPPALLKPCPPKQRTRLVTNGDLVNRLIYTEGALDTCSAQVDGIRAWNDGPH